MATYHMPARSGGVHKTLSTTTVDTVRLPTSNQPHTYLVRNRSSTIDLWVRLDGTDPVAEADGTIRVPPLEARLFEDVHGAHCRLLGNAQKYDVEYA